MDSEAKTTLAFILSVFGVFLLIAVMITSANTERFKTCIEAGMVMQGQNCIPPEAVGGEGGD